MTPEAIQNLIERCEKATGPDRFIDAMMHLMLRPELGEAPWFQPHVAWWVYRGEGQEDDQHAPLYTASIDAALALMEKVLPGWSWYAGSVGEQDIPQATVTEPFGDCRDFVAHAPTAPLAIILAFLRALQSQAAP